MAEEKKMDKEGEREDKMERDDADAGALLKTCIDRLDEMHKRMDAMEMTDRKKKDEAEEKDEPERAAADKKKDSEEERDDSTVFYKGEKAPLPKKDSEEDLKRDAKKKDAEREDVSEKEEEEERKDRKSAKKDESKSEREMADAFDPREAIAQLERRLPKMLTDDERAMFSDIQARADSVYHAFGQRAPAPLEGETTMAYRQRLAKKLKTHSSGFKDVNLYAIADDAAFTAIENTIYADAMKVAFSPATADPGTLRAVKESRGGHEFITYVGDPAAWMNSFAGPVRMHVTSFNTPNGSAR